MTKDTEQMFLCRSDFRKYSRLFEIEKRSFIRLSSLPAWPVQSKTDVFALL